MESFLFSYRITSFFFILRVLFGPLINEIKLAKNQEAHILRFKMLCYSVITRIFIGILWWRVILFLGNEILSVSIPQTYLDIRILDYR